MGLLDRLLKREEFYQYRREAIPEDTGYCSDRECPCPGTPIPRGTGYLYISEEAVEFMRAKLRGKVPNNILFVGVMPVLMCEQGARLRGVDLEVAAADAKRWWDTGKVRLRATPTAKGA